jgi:Fe-S-cluster-containing hydrogenase component 2
VDADECTGCFACKEICSMNAIDTDKGEDVALVNLDRCIGCGLCVTVCEFDAMSLKDKAKTERIEPPANIVETYMNIAKEKGLF